MVNQEILSNKEIEEVREKFIDKDIVEEDVLVDLEEKKKKSGVNKIIFAEVFLTCYDYLYMNVYLFDDEKKIKDYLQEYFEMSNNLRNLFEEIGDTFFPTPHFSREKIKDIVDSNRTRMNDIIQFFFKISREEE